MNINIFMNHIKATGNSFMTQALPSHLNTSSAPMLKKAMEALLSSGAPTTHLDLSHVERIGFGCAQVLLAGKKTALNKNYDLKISLSDELKSTLDTLGILPIIQQ